MFLTRLELDLNGKEIFSVLNINEGRCIRELRTGPMGRELCMRGLF